MYETREIEMALTLSANDLKGIDFGGTRAKVDFTKYSTGETVALVENEDFSFTDESSSADYVVKLTATDPTTGKSHKRTSNECWEAFKLKAYNWGRKNGYRLARFSKVTTIKGKGCIVIQFVKVPVVETSPAETPAAPETPTAAPTAQSAPVETNGKGDAEKVSKDNVKVAA